MVARVKRKELLRLGKRGDLVRVVVDKKEGQTVVLYRNAHGVPDKSRFPITRAGQDEAIAFAEGWFSERARLRAEALKPSVTTVRALWDAFKAVEFSDVEGEGLRAATQVNYTNHWNRFERFVGKDRDATTVKAPEMATLKKELQKLDIALNQIKQTFSVVRTVYRWGVHNEIIEHSPLVLLRMKDRKDAAPALNPDAFTEEEFEAILRELDATDSRQWRGWVAVMLAGHHGQRARAIQHLRWQDINFDSGTITWPGRFQKTGRDLTQPILWETYSALLTARQRREEAESYRVLSHHKNRQPASEQLKHSDWVLFAERDKTKAVSYQTLQYHLVEAQARAKVERRDFRGFHGFKKLTVTRVIEATGDRMLGMEYVGNKSVKLLANYDKGVSKRIELAAEATARSSRKVSGKSPENKNATDTSVDGEAQLTQTTGVTRS